MNCLEQSNYSSETCLGVLQRSQSNASEGGGRARNAWLLLKCISIQSCCETYKSRCWGSVCWQCIPDTIVSNFWVRRLINVCGNWQLIARDVRTSTRKLRQSVVSGRATPPD
jgi:hypothetical protein